MGQGPGKNELMDVVGLMEGYTQAAGQMEHIFDVHWVRELKDAQGNPVSQRAATWARPNEYVLTLAADEYGHRCTTMTIAEWFAQGPRRRTLKHYSSGQHLLNLIHWGAELNGMFGVTVHSSRCGGLMEQCLQQQMRSGGGLSMPDNLDSIQFTVNYGDRRTVLMYLRGVVSSCWLDAEQRIDRNTLRYARCVAAVQPSVAAAKLTQRASQRLRHQPVQTLQEVVRHPHRTAWRPLASGLGALLPRLVVQLLAKWCLGRAGYHQRTERSRG